MPTLSSRTQQKVLLPNLKIATRFLDRGVGLLGRRGLAENEALWINPCNSIHTFFMNFAIDCVFVDRQMKIQKIYHTVQPWRMTMPIWRARSVIEMAAGQAKRLGLQIGEVLDVGIENPQQ